MRSKIKKKMNINIIQIQYKMTTPKTQTQPKTQAKKTQAKAQPKKVPVVKAPVPQRQRNLLFL